ncbi:hypothetical protein QBC43DRAFT_309139 [Cladorrhinum sp. PSN259]|nr:hypothetical protein QBC43DRAFT_309139 [Cladorrhinum sp. PSN259]
MANNTLLTDDYVAELLAKEANEASTKYSSMGLEAFRSTKPSNKAKPNTRFLGRIIKETTNHNAALRAREAAEAQARLDRLTEAEEKKRRKFNPSASDIRRRQLGDISSILHGRKRRMAGDDEKEQDNKATRKDGRLEKGEQNKEHESSSRDRRSAIDSLPKEKGNERTQRRSSRREEDDRIAAPEHRHRHRSDRSRSPARRGRKHRDRSPLSSEIEDGDSHRSTKSHHRSGRRSDKDDDRSRTDDLFRSEASKGKMRAHHGRLDGDSTSVVDTAKKARSGRSNSSGRLSDQNQHEAQDSDPLDEFIGPAPPSRSPVRMRGRGAILGAAAMDSRFSEDYDPALDINMDSGATASTKWEDAVEGFRDRQKLKQQGAQRLRAAGFTEEQIKRWEKGGEKDIDDVRWTEAGGQREWDRGKDDST